MDSHNKRDKTKASSLTQISLIIPNNYLPYTTTLECGHIRITAAKDILEIAGNLNSLRCNDKYVVGNLLQVTIDGIAAAGCEINNTLRNLYV